MGTDADAPTETTGAAETGERVPGWVVVYLKGVAMGLADSVPGVSGGTIALVTGIYERLVTAIAAADPRAVRHALRLHAPAGRAALLAELREMDVPFLLALGAGIATALVVVSRGMEVALAEYTAPTYGFFFGLIGASVVVLYDEVSVTTPRRALLAAGGFLAAFALTGATATGAPHSPVVVFVAGAVAVTAMVLPGVSGAFLLLVLGQYQFMLGVLREFTDGMAGLLSGGDPGGVVGPAGTVAVFLAGAAVGLLTVAHAIRWALSRYREATLTLLVSLMAGGLRLPGQKVLATGTESPAAVAGVVLAGAVGAVAVLALDRYTDDLEYT